MIRHDKFSRLTHSEQLTLSSSSGIDSANRLASSEISASVSRGIACVKALRFDPGRFSCEASMGLPGADVEGDAGADSDADSLPVVADSLPVVAGL